MMEVVPYGRQMENNKAESTGTETETKPMEKNRRFMAEPAVEPLTPTTPTSTNGKNSEKMVRYRECMRNHAALIGGHANDGCGEFMPGGELLKCAACGCHRNFHRKEVLGVGCVDHHLLHPPGVVLKYAVGPTQRWDKKISGGGGGGGGGFAQLYHHHSGGGVFGAIDLRNQNESREDRRSETPEERGGEVGGGSRSCKRFRTKFTQEQKEKMLEFAERIGWRIQRHDDVALSQFCLEVGVKRHVLKVWMHNNKNTLRRRDNVETEAATEAEAEAEAAPEAREAELAAEAEAEAVPSLHIGV